MNPAAPTPHTGRPAPDFSIFTACSIVMFVMLSGVAGAATYNAASGIGNINSNNSSYWSTVLSNNDSIVATNINIINGSLNLINATIRMYNGYYIYVKNNATMNITNGSTITHYYGYYYFIYQEGSYGYLSNSTIEYSTKLQIDTKNNLAVNNMTIRNNAYYGIHLTPSSGNVNITNSSITNSATGTDTYSIYIQSSGNNILRNNNINGTVRNLYVEGNFGNDIDTSNRVNGGRVYYSYNSRDVSIAGDNVGHITIYNSSNISIYNNALVANGDGIRLINSINNVTIEKNTLYNSNYYGIDLTSSRANITNNTIITSDLTAISLSGYDNSNITNNTVSGGSTASGIRLSGSNDNKLTNNTVTGTGSENDGIELSTSNNNKLTGNILTYSGGNNGIKLSSSSYNNLTNNTIKSKSAEGVNLIGSSSYNTIIYNDIISNSGAGIAISSSSNNILNNSILSNSGDGVTVFSSTNNSVSNNNISLNSQNGIKAGSSGNRFSNNILAENVDNGIYIQIDDNTFSNNAITRGAGYGLYIDFGQYDNYIYQNNTVNGEKIYYYFNSNNIQTVTVEPLTVSKVSNVGKISLIKSSNLNIKNNIISDNKYIDGGVPSGIFLYNSTGNTISNNTITNNYRGIYLYDSSNNNINNSNNINTSEDRGIYFNISNHNNITNSIVGLNAVTGIYFNFSNYNNITGNDITGSPEGILFDTSLNNSVFINSISNYTFSAIRLIEYSLNNTMIGNTRSNRNSAQFDIYINDSINNIVAANQTTAANYTFYLIGDTRVATLDTVFNKTKAGYEDTSDLTLMWRIDVLSWDKKHIEPIWGNLTVRYGDYSDVGGILLWDGEVVNANGRLSHNSLDYWGPPDSGDNWLVVIEYRQNATGKINYQSTPMNATVINRWDKLQNINKSYRNITQTIEGPGITIIVDAGYTPNGKCYYCHRNKLTYRTMVHWTDYSESLTDMSNPYTPGRCIDCHDKNDSANVPHGTGSGKDMLVKQSPQLCYNGNGNQTCHNSSTVRVTLNQKAQFNQTTHHELGEGKMSCFSCHDNHGTENRFDLHRPYSNSNYYTYNSNDYSLCFVCHLEEKLKANIYSTGYLAGFRNQTNFRDEYFGYPYGFNGSYENLHTGPHMGYSCYYCHSPHGSDSPAMTKGLSWTYITNITPPGTLYPYGDWANQMGLDQANWSNFTLNQAAGMGPGTKCGYHSGSFRLPSTFVYREFVDYESAGGPNCVGCHDSSNPDAIRKILNVSALKLAMHTNLSWNFRNGGELQGTGKNWTQWGVERGYNASNISTDNAICWSCHSSDGLPPYPGFHPDRTLAPYQCPKCHGPIGGQPPHTKGLVVAIDNHGPTTKGAGSVYIQTNAGTNGSCENCHAPSKLPDSSIGALTVWKNGAAVSFTGRTTAGDVSHYGLSRQQGQSLGISNPLINTSNCLFCHTDSTKGAIWGNAVNISGNMYGTDTANVSQCYTYCHVLPDYVGIVNENNIANFHNKSVYSGGGPNCVTCHDANGIYHVQSLVNATSIAQGIHANMGNNTIELIPDIDPRSKSCWGCHQTDGTEPENMGDRNGITDPGKRPWKCEDCHTRSSEWVAATGDGESWLAASYPPNKLPPQVYAHYQNSSTVKTNVNGEGRCVDCHNNSIDPYSNDTTGKVLGNTIFSNVSHYGLNKSRGSALGLMSPLFDTIYCGICHNSSANAAIWGNATQNDHGNFANYSAQDRCYVCHSTDNQTPPDFHAVTLMPGQGGVDCLRCHNNSGFSKNRRINGTIFSEAIHRNLNNASTMEYGLNRTCWTCHFENGRNASNHSMLKVRAYLCPDCHNKIGGSFINVSNAPNIYNHFKNGTTILAYLTRTADTDSCMGCHNKSEMFTFYLPDENETKPYYTNYSITSHYGSNRTDLVDKYNASNSTGYCSYCHRNNSTIFIEYENNKNIQHLIASDCSSPECHGPGRLHNESLVRPHTGGNCTDCHLEGGINATGGIPFINKTGFMAGFHSNITGDLREDNYSGTSRVCWGCHNNYSEQLINATHTEPVSNLPECEGCHDSPLPYNSEYLKTPPMQVKEHKPDGEDIRTNASLTSCEICHNISLTILPPSANVKYREPKNYISHYGRQRTDMLTEENLTDCAYCHKNQSGEYIAMFRNIEKANVTHDGNTECDVCHGVGRIHDRNLSRPKMTGGNNSLCLICHELPEKSGGKVVKQSEFSISVHANIDCTDCHTPRQEFKGTIVSSESISRTFNVPSNIEWMNATPEDSIELKLISPDGKNYTGNNISIISPLAGNWTSIISGGDSSYSIKLDFTLNHPGSTPKICADCHIDGFGDAVKVYRHISNQSIVPTNTSCVTCHSKDAPYARTEAMKASHYAPLSPPLDSGDCIRCHYGVVSGFGNPPDPRNHTRYADINVTMTTGEAYKLVDNYSIALIETTQDAGIFTIEKDGRLLSREIVAKGNAFVYEVTGIEPEKIRIINLTVNKLFSSRKGYVAQLSGTALASRIHRETERDSCYACHDKEYRTNMPEGMDYYVIKKEIENITLARMPVNFSENKTIMLGGGQGWDIGEGYYLDVQDVSTDRRNAKLRLYRNGTLIEDALVNEGSNFTYEEQVLDRKITVFTIKLDSIFIGQKPVVVLSHARLIAGELFELNSTIQVTGYGTPVKYLRLDSMLSVGKKPEKFHVNTITPGEYSPDCISCHTGEGIAPYKLDLESFKTGVHAGLNKDATHTDFLSDNMSKACWACHGNGSEPDEHLANNMGNWTPKICVECHVNPVFGVKQVYSHYPGAAVSTRATCIDCHSNTLSNKSNSLSNTSITLSNNVPIETLNLAAGVSHYSNRNGLPVTSSCDVCHNNSTSVWGSPPQVREHNPNNNCLPCHGNVSMFHDLGITVVRNCQDCHQNREKARDFNLTIINTHYPGAPDGKANTLEKNNYTCRICHNATNNSMHSYLEVRRYDNETFGYCFQCHSGEGKFPYKPQVQIMALKHGSGEKVISGCEACHSSQGISKFHTPTLISKSYFSDTGNYKIECTSCHQKHEEREYQPFANIQCTDCHTEYGANHYANARLRDVDQSEACKICHNKDAEVFHNLTHKEANVTEGAYEPCRACHAQVESIRGEHNRSDTILKGTMLYVSGNKTVGSNITCTSCHNATGNSQFHYDNYPLGAVQNPGWQNWSAGNVTGCKDCHTYFGGEPPFNATNMGTQGRSPAGTAHGYAPNCTLCHGGSDPVRFHSLAATEFIPRTGIMLIPENVNKGDQSLLQVQVVLPPLMKVTRAEYFIDELGRQGYGLQLSYIQGESSGTSVLLGANIDTKELSDGKHLIFVRVKDSAGKWSKPDIAVLTVIKPWIIEAAQTYFIYLIPVIMIFAVFILVWRRFR